MKKSLLLFALGLSLFAGSSFVILSSGGIVGKTGSPGETTCSGCHSGGAGTTSVSISTTPSITSNQFLPGQTYTVTVTVANASFSQFGFGCEILNSSNANAGTMANAQAGVFFANAGAKTNAIHSTPKSGTGTADFSFEWTAPTSGNATIYAAGNAINGTGNTTGDKPGNTSLALTLLSTNLSERPVSSFNLNLYPNPSSNKINIEYLLATNANVNIAMYDLKGSEVALLLNEQQAAGAQTLNADISANIEKGIYIIKMSVNDRVATQKLFVKR